MTNEEIRLEIDQAYANIVLAEKRLENLREICNHEKTYIGNYSWRVGSIQSAELCEYCDKLIKYTNE